MGINNVMLIVAIVCLSMTKLPSAKQEITSPTPSAGAFELPAELGCLKSIDKCVAESNGPITDPTAKLDYSKCCSEIETVVTTNATCFCTLEEYYKNLTRDYDANVKNITETLNTTTYNPPPLPPFSKVELEYNNIFEECSIDTTFAKLCQDVTDSESANASSKKDKMSENGATKIKSVIGLIPGAIFVWMMIMS